MTRKKADNYPFENIHKSGNVTIARFPHKVEWENYYTKKMDGIDELVIIGKDISGTMLSIVREIRKIEDGKVVWKCAEFIHHLNVYADSSTTIVDGYKITFQNFCTGANGLGGLQLNSSPKATLANVAYIIQTQNIGSPANTSMKSIYNSDFDFPIFDYDTGALIEINEELNPLCLLATSSKPDRIIEFTSENNHVLNTNTGYYIKKKGDGYYTYSAKKPDKRSKISTYYPIIPVSELKDSISNVPREKYDIICMGLGSAGGNILEQVARTRFADSFLLCDFDIVEKKNLRNQPYLDCDVWSTKSQSMKKVISRINTKTKVLSFNKAYESVSWKFYESKYTILGFDSIECRLGALDLIANGELKTSYIIDCRYSDLECSIYFVDTSDTKQMDYYREQLLSDLSKLSSEEKSNIWNRSNTNSFYQRYRHDGCSGFWDRLGVMRPCHGNGGCSECLDRWVRILNKYNITPEEATKAISMPIVRELTSPATESSCVAWDIIDIYKYSSSYVLATIREIETSKLKPFTHIEATTAIIPKHILIKK